mmetsp:Transcript_7195/g.17949  ORF Transcript_7195/g.17949 Transcript_7195/m.17949 type:complete len:364 (-) Transcript_7195:27-1118(-)
MHRNRRPTALAEHATAAAAAPAAAAAGAVGGLRTGAFLRGLRRCGPLTVPTISVTFCLLVGFRLFALVRTPPGSRSLLPRRLACGGHWGCTSSYSSSSSSFFSAATTVVTTGSNSTFTARCWTSFATIIAGLASPRCGLLFAVLGPQLPGSVRKPTLVATDALALLVPSANRRFVAQVGLPQFLLSMGELAIGIVALPLREGAADASFPEVRYTLQFVLVVGESAVLAILAAALLVEVAHLGFLHLLGQGAAAVALAAALAALLPATASGSGTPSTRAATWWRRQSGRMRHGGVARRRWGITARIAAAGGRVMWRRPPHGRRRHGGHRVASVGIHPCLMLGRRPPARTPPPLPASATYGKQTT